MFFSSTCCRLQRNFSASRILKASKSQDFRLTTSQAASKHNNCDFSERISLAIGVDGGQQIRGRLGSFLVLWNLFRINIDYQKKKNKKNMPRKSQGEKDKEKKEADQQRQVTSYFKTVSVAGDKPSNVNLLKRPRDNPSRGSPSEENHYQNKRTRGRSIKRTKRRRKRTNAVKIPQDH